MQKTLRVWKDPGLEKFVRGKVAARPLSSINAQGYPPIPQDVGTGPLRSISFTHPDVAKRLQLCADDHAWHITRNQSGPFVGVLQLGLFFTLSYRDAGNWGAGFERKLGEYLDYHAAEHKAEVYGVRTEQTVMAFKLDFKITAQYEPVVNGITGIKTIRTLDRYLASLGI
jgi:hypothetical protein